MARTAGLLIAATLLVCLLPLFPGSNLPQTSSQVAATNSSLPHRLVWIDVSAGILPVAQSSVTGGRAARSPAVEKTAEDGVQKQAANVGGGRQLPPPPVPAAVHPVRRPEETRTWEAAREFLRSRGIERFRLETVGQPPRYRFTCWVPLDANPFVTRQFVGEAREELAAVWAAIAEIEAWEKR